MLRYDSIYRGSLRAEQGAAPCGLEEVDVRFNTVSRRGE